MSVDRRGAMRDRGEDQRLPQSPDRVAKVAHMKVNLFFYFWTKWSPQWEIIGLFLACRGSWEVREWSFGCPEKPFEVSEVESRRISEEATDKKSFWEFPE